MILLGPFKLKRFFNSVNLYSVYRFPFPSFFYLVVSGYSLWYKTQFTTLLQNMNQLKWLFTHKNIRTATHSYIKKEMMTSFSIHIFRPSHPILLLSPWPTLSQNQNCRKTLNCISSGHTRNQITNFTRVMHILKTWNKALP